MSIDYPFLSQSKCGNCGALLSPNEQHYCGVVPASPSTATAGAGDAMRLQAAMEGQQLCALGHHAWLPWLQITDNSGATAYVTRCVRCRVEEAW